MKADLNVLPWGLCPDCLTRLRNADDHDGVELRDGTKFLHAFCEHREAGAMAVIRPGKPVSWSIRVPVDVLVWEKQVAMRLALQFGPELSEDVAQKNNMH